MMEKIDVMDMIINVLKEHEKNLDAIAFRLEALEEILAKAGLLVENLEILINTLEDETQ